MKHIKLFERYEIVKNDYTIYDLITMDDERFFDLFYRNITDKKPNIDLIQKCIDTGRIEEISYSDLQRTTKEVQQFIISEKNKNNIKITGIFTLSNLPKELFNYIHEYEDMIIFLRNKDSQILKDMLSEDDWVYCEYEFKDMKLFAESFIMPISINHDYTIYNKTDDKIILFKNFDIEDTYYGDRDDTNNNYIVELSADFSELSGKDVREFFTNKIFSRIREDELCIKSLPRDLQFDETTKTYNLFLDDYDDLAGLFPDDQRTVEKVLSDGIYYDYFESYSDYMFHYVDKKHEELFRELIIKHNPEIDTEEILSSKGLQRYIEHSNEDIAEQIKECIERAYNRAYESAYSDGLWRAVVEPAYEFLTGKTYNEGSFSWVDGKLLIKDIQTDLVIMSLFHGGNFIDRINYEWLEDSEKPEYDLERAEYNVSVKDEVFNEELENAISEEGLIK